MPDATDSTVFTCKSCFEQNNSWVRCYGPNDNVEGFEGSSAVATQCKDSFFVFGNACVELKSFTNCYTIRDSNSDCATCEEGYYLAGNVCKECSGSCAECKEVEGAEQCVECEAKYYLSASD